MKRRVRFALMLMGLVLLLAAIRERYDPFLVLFLDDLVHPKARPLEVALTEDVSLRLYEDTRPHVGKVASLQKGPVLIYQGHELVEEGYGFGLPIVLVDDVAYLSRHATASLVHDGERTILVKTYTIDVADRPTRFLQVKFEDVVPLGSVVFSYTINNPSTIDIEVDFTGLDVAWDAAYLMNEQGAINFPTYQDEKGQTWSGDDIGIWQPTDAATGCWLSQEEMLRFCVQTEPGRRKYVGRERYNLYRWTGIFYLSWSGVDIEIAPPLPRYRYTIRVERVP